MNKPDTQRVVKEKTDLLASMVGLVALDHKADSIESAFGLLENEVKEVDSFLALIATKKKTETIQALWNSEQFNFYQRLYGVFKFGWSKGAGVNQKGAKS